LLGLILLPKQLSQERKDAQLKARGSDSVPLKPSPPASKKALRGVKISTPMSINDEEEWKRENGLKPQSLNDIPSEESHHSPKAVQHAEKF
jgi:hypothetical protein